jgi:hypothetical protein
VGDLLGVPLAIVVIALMTLATVPLAFGLLEGQRAERAA